MSGERSVNPIAIVGLGAILPGARGVAEFWANALAGRSALRTPLPAARFTEARYLADAVAPDQNGRARQLTGGYVVDDWEFDWRKFRVPPADAASVNPMQFVALSAAVEALDGVKALPRETTAVLLGASGLGYQKDSGLRIHEAEMLEALEASLATRGFDEGRRAEILKATRAAFEAGLRECSSDNAVGSLASVAAARIAMHFDLSGAHYAVDVDHASALAAVEIACRGLVDGEWDCVVTGGVSELLTPLEWVAYDKLGYISPTGVVAPFDALADGTLLGEGAAMFVLKRLADAERDGDFIHALITGTSVTSSPDGAVPTAMLRHSALSRAMRSALASAGADPSGVQFVECDAPGVPKADADELGALKTVYGERASPLAVGSVKPLVGHLRAASGAVALLRATLALQHRALPPQQAPRSPSGAVDARIKVPSAPEPWPTLPPLGVPRAGVSALSLSASAAHVVLEALVPGRAPGGTGSIPPPSQKSDADPPSIGPPRSIPPRPPREEPIAILGIGGIYADAPNLERFWDNLVHGRDAVTDVPAARFPIDRYYSADPGQRERSVARMGSFVDLPRPEPEDRIEPAAVPQLDASHLLFLRAAEQAIADVGAGAKRWNRRRVGAYVGYMPFQAKKFAADARINVREFTAAAEQALAASGALPAEGAAVASDVEARFSRARPTVSAHSLPGWLSSVMAARVGRRYGFEGPCIAVESACASTLSALHAAAQALRHGACDVALAGASFCDIPVEFYVGTSRFNGLSPKGIYPFDAKASGFVPGEGAGVFVLKRLADAERDGDHVRAVLASIGSSSDGKGGRSLLSPSVEGEALSIQRSLASAGIDPATVDYVECHGTATPVGDAMEGMALACSYGGAPRRHPVAIGSVKSNLGHLCAAAGAPALTKVVLAMERGEIPPSIHCNNPNPKIDFAAASAEITRERTPWPKTTDRPRRAGVSTFGIGGTNFHAIVEEYRVVRKAPWTSFWVGGEPPDSTRGVSSSVSPGQLFAFAFESAGRCLTEATACLAQFRGGSAKDFAEAARTTRAQATAGARGAAKVRLALTAFGPDDLARKIDTLGRTLASDWAADTLRGSGIFLNTNASARPRRPLVAVFPGMGPQYPNMLRQLAGHYPLVERILSRADAVWQSLTGRTLRSALWTSQEHGLAARDEDLHGGMLATSCAISALMRFYGVRADVCVGQSAGELAALVTARVLSFEDALTAMHARTLAVLDLTIRDTGRMASVMCNAATLHEIIDGIDGKIVVAADNCPTTVLAAGETKAMEALSWRCAARGIEYIPFRVSHAYHSPVIAKAASRYRHVLESFAWNAPTAEVISTVDLRPYTADKRDGIERLVSQYTTMVRLREAIELLYARGARNFFESGPRWAVTGYIRETLGKRPHIAHPSVHPKVGEVELFRRLLACAFTEGVGSLHPVRSDDTFEGPVSRADFDAQSRRPPRSVGIEFTAPDDMMGPPSSRPAPASKGVTDDVRIVFRKSGERREAVNPVNTQDRLKDALIAALSERTGYPKQMLELDLDLEGDLGIDTVKQVEVFTKVRQQFGLPRLEGTTLRDLNTLRKVLHHFEAQLRGETPPAPVSVRSPASVRGPISAHSSRSTRSNDADEWSAPPSILPRPLTEFVPPPPRTPTPAFGVRASARATADAGAASEPAGASERSSFDRVQGFLVRSLAERTGYPTEMLELDLDLEGDLGIDTVKQVEVITKVRQHFELPRQSGTSIRDMNTLRKIIQSLATQIEATSTPTQSSANEGISAGKVASRPLESAQEAASHERPVAPLPSSAPAPTAQVAAAPPATSYAAPAASPGSLPEEPKGPAASPRALPSAPRLVTEEGTPPQPRNDVSRPAAVTWAFGGPITPPSARESRATPSPQIGSSRGGSAEQVGLAPITPPSGGGRGAAPQAVPPAKGDKTSGPPIWDTSPNLIEASGPISVRSGANGIPSEKVFRSPVPKAPPGSPHPPPRPLIVAGARVQALQRVVDHSPERLVADAHFSSARDRYLSGVRLAGRPCVPVSMAFEALAEAAELLDGHRVTSVVDLRSHRPLFLDERGERWVSVEATVLGPGRVRAELTSAGEQEGRTVYQEGIFLTGGAPDIDVPRNVTAALRYRPGAEHRGRAPTFQHPLHLGEAMSGSVWARALSFCELIGGISVTDEALLSGSAEPAFVLSPSVFESGLMLAGFGWYSLTGLAGVVNEVERVLLGRVPLPYEELACHLRLRRSTPSSMTADLTILGDGGAPVMKMIGVRMVRLDALLLPPPEDSKEVYPDAGTSWESYRVLLEDASLEQ
jgi:acyl transferase domain-containing protein